MFSFGDLLWYNGGLALFLEYVEPMESLAWIIESGSMVAHRISVNELVEYKGDR